MYPSNNVGSMEDPLTLRQTVRVGFGHHNRGAAMMCSVRAFVRWLFDDPSPFPATATAPRKGIATRLSSVNLVPRLTICNIGTVRRNLSSAIGNTLTTSDT